jgi:hypothetical protein
MNYIDSQKVSQEIDSSRPVSGTQWFMISITLLLLVFPAWIRGGTARQYLTPYPWIATVILFLFLLTPYLRRGSHSSRCMLVREHVRGILRDPIFYLGTAFLCLLFIQWWNSGKALILVQGGEKVILSPAFINWLPSAMDNTGSWDMVVWFYPTFVALLMVRHGFSHPWMLKILIWGMVINASFLAIFGLVAPVLFKNYPLWLTPILPRQQMFFFSTFGYPNHAGSFFILHLGLACGLFFYYYTVDNRKAGLWIKSGVLLGIILFLFYTVHMTRCLYAIYFSWMTAVFFVSYLLFKTIKKKKNRHVQLVPIGMVIISLLLMTLFVISFLANKKKSPELWWITKPAKIIEEQLDSRLWSIKAAVKIWKDYPIFGVGGGGYSKCLLPYVGLPKEKYICLSNVHNDLMQFLCELGIVGTVLILSIFVLLVFRIAYSGVWKKPFVFFGLLGVSGVLIHSLIDLPFRSPPIIIAFVVVLAGYGMLQTKQRQEEQIIKKKGFFTSFVTRFVNFYTIFFFFISIVVWWAFTPVRQDISRNIVRDVDKKYEAKLITPRYDNVTPGQSRNASPALLRSLWWAKLLYAEYKDLHLLSAKINFDLYRNAGANNKKAAKSYLREALRSSLTARRFTTYGDIEFVKLHTAVLDALGYYLEESWCVKCFRDIYAKDIRVNLLVREFYFRRPYLFR